MPEIIIVKNEAEAGEIYARCVADLIKSKPNAVLGLATGSSPLAAYRALASGTRVKTLVEQTRADNARFFDDDINQVPTHCITQGIGTIMRARHLVLLAFGEGKAEAIRQTCEGGISAFCPASALQMHPHATIIVDEAAASRLSHKDYYEYAYAHKPAWQGI